MSDFARDEILDACRGFGACAQRRDSKTSAEHRTDEARGRERPRFSWAYSSCDTATIATLVREYAESRARGI